MASHGAEPRQAITYGTENVFADLGFPDAAERQAKLRLAYTVNEVPREYHLAMQRVGARIRAHED